MIVKWKTSSISKTIKRVECTKESANSVWLTHTWGNNNRIERRHPKVSQHEGYHDTWEAARRHLVAEAEERIEIAQSVLQIEQETLDKLNALTPPENA